MDTMLRSLIWSAPQPRHVCFFVVIVLLFLRATMVHAEDGQPSVLDVPRYRLKIGQELHYQQLPDENLLPRSSDEEKKQSRYERHTHWWIWVVRQNDAGGWRLLIRKQLRHIVIHPEKMPSTYFENDFFGYCDLQPDGSFETNPTLGGHAYFKTHPDEIVDRLPPDAKAIRDGWKYTSPFEGAQYTLRAATREKTSLHFTAIVERPEDRVQEYRMTRRFTFDDTRGFVTQIVDEYESKQANHAFHVRRPIQLVSVKDRSPEWLSSLVAEVEGCLAAQVDAFALLEKATRARTKADCQAAMDQSHDRLRAARAISQLTEIQTVLDAALELQVSDAEREVTAAANREELFAQPPIDWESTDFDGGKRQQADYRGKVVLMDFWFRGCGHCIRAMPIINKVAGHYKDKDVVVLGINVDADERDARQVIASCSLSYPNLRGKEISEKYRVNAYPTVIVLDQAGRIANFPHSEHIDDLFEQITGVIDELLERPSDAK